MQQSSPYDSLAPSVKKAYCCARRLCRGAMLANATRALDEVYWPLLISIHLMEIRGARSMRSAEPFKVRFRCRRVFNAPRYYDQIQEEMLASQCMRLSRCASLFTWYQLMQDSSPTTAHRISISYRLHMMVIGSNFGDSSFVE
jgi:hypothetical protein